MATSHTIATPRTLARRLMTDYGAEPTESVIAILLDPESAIIKMRRIFSGSRTQTTVRVREIARYALVEGAAAVVVAHNHPSGDPQPSEPDRLFTNQLAAGLRLLDLVLADHLIVSKSEYFSFHQDGLL